MNNKGFTLIEVMVVLVILGMLATFLAPKILNRTDDARLTQAKNDIITMESALDLYKLDNGFYPTTEQGLKALVAKPESDPQPRNWKTGGYIKATDVPTDPWGNPFIYRSPGDDSRDYEIISLGGDGKEGGTGMNADIKNYELR